MASKKGPSKSTKKSAPAKKKANTKAKHGAKKPSKSKGQGESFFAKAKRALLENSEQRPVPPIWESLRRSFRLIREHRTPILKVGSIYAALYFVFIRVLTTLDTDQILSSVASVFGDGSQTTFTRILAVGNLYSESISFGDSQTGLLFVVITMVCSLAFIWILRMVWSNQKISVREAFYSGMYPIVPMSIITMLGIVQILPFTIGSLLLSSALNNSLAIGLGERIFFAGIFLLGVLISGYLIIGSIIAMYATTVPGMTPTAALRGSKKLLKGRRFAVLKQIFIFMIVTAVLAVVPLLLVIAIHSDAALVATALMVVLALPWMHLYFYGLYRDLLDE